MTFPLQQTFKDGHAAITIEKAMIQVGVLKDSTIMPIVILSVNAVAGVEFKLERTAHESIRGGFWISPPRMGGACEQVSELQQFPDILSQRQLDDTFAHAWDHHINAGAVYSRASKYLVRENIIV